MHAERQTVTVTTNADGDGTAYTSSVVTGQILSVIYRKPVSGGFDDGVDFTVSTEDTLQSIWAQSDVNASATRSPRQATHGTDGVASVYASGGTAVQGPVVAVQERIKFVVAQGGNTKTGTFILIVV